MSDEIQDDGNSNMLQSLNGIVSMPNRGVNDSENDTVSGMINLPNSNAKRYNMLYVCICVYV